MMNGHSDDIEDQVRVSVRNIVRAHIRETVPPEFEMTASLKDDLGIDALDLVEIGITVEDTWQVELVGDMEWRTPKDIVEAVWKALGGK